MDDDRTSSIFDDSRMSSAAAAPLARAKPFEHPFGGIRWVATMLRDPIQACPRELFDTDFMASGKPGRRRVLLGNPDLIQRALVKEADAFVETTRTLGPLLGRGLLTSTGTHWRWQRRLIAPSFRPDRLDGFASAMSRAAEATADRWRAHPDGATIDLGEAMTRCTFDIIAETMLSGGKNLDVLQFEQAISTSLGVGGWRVLYGILHLPGWVPHPRRRRARAAEHWLRSCALGIVASRRAELAAAGGGRDDLLDLLLQAQDPEGEGGSMSDRDIVDNILTFIFAGHQTTANALTWAFYALSQHPDIADRLCSEAASVVGDGAVGPEHVNRLVYARKVAQEVLRLFPPVPAITRKTRRAVTIGDLELAPGDMVIVPIYVVQRHRALWTDPDQFDPERFSTEATSTRHRYSFMPFGIGPRTCIGLNFAINEMVVILATLLPRFRLELAPGAAPQVTVKLTLRPREPMRMSVAHRKAA